MASGRHTDRTRSRDDQALLDELLDGLPRQRNERGHYLPGHTLGGRTPGFDFRSIVAKFAAENGEPVEEALSRIYLGILRSAAAGDVAAARLLIERLCGKETDVVDLTVGKRKMSDTERAARVAAIMHAGGWKRDGDGE